MYSDYTSNQIDLAGSDESKLKIGNKYFKLKENLNYNHQGLNIDAGFSFINYIVNPGQLEPLGEVSVIIPRSVKEEKARESALYTDATFTLSPRLSVSGGLRFTLYQYLGPRDIFTYLDPEHPSVDAITGTEFNGDQILHQEGLLQPRLSARYLINASNSLKGGYARTSQYINQISNNDTPTPTSLWQLTNHYIPSQLSHKFFTGLF
ncbi:MAG: TonB-dependent receptor [Saprospiraceae bacterium]|nr:TonB-dependent receptor [Saprospiraceae bacterium]